MRNWVWEGNNSPKPGKSPNRWNYLKTRECHHTGERLDWGIIRKLWRHFVQLNTFCSGNYLTFLKIKYHATERSWRIETWKTEKRSSTWTNLPSPVLFPLFSVKFCSEEYLIHLEIIRKGENLANWDMKGGLKLRNIHEVTKATKGFLFWLEQLYL